LKNKDKQHQAEPTCVDIEYDEDALQKVCALELNQL